MFTFGFQVIFKLSFFTRQEIIAFIYLQWCMRQFTELEVQFTRQDILFLNLIAIAYFFLPFKNFSVDRINEYSMLEDEGELKSKSGHKPPTEWPRRGKIEFKNVTMRYFKGKI